MVPAVCSGDMVVAVSMSEPDAGSALTDLKTKGVVKGDKRRVEDRLRVLNQILDLVYDSEAWKAGRHSTYQRIKILFTPHLESTEWEHVRERLEYIHNTWVKISTN